MIPPHSDESVVLVACCGPKVVTPAPAAVLYVPSRSKADIFLSTTSGSAAVAHEGIPMIELTWDGSYRIEPWLNGIMSYRPDQTGDANWPPSRQGVYVVTAAEWSANPWNVTNDELLYVGGGRNLLHRIGQLVRDLLGFCGPSDDGGRYAGSHIGGEKLWCYCNLTDAKWRELNTKGFQLEDLYIGWAVTSKPCHTCVESDLLLHHRGVLNQRKTAGTKCCCTPT
jgi:hypothetical protein